MGTDNNSIETEELSFTCARCNRTFQREYPGSSFQDFRGPNEMYLATVFPLGERELINVCGDHLLDTDTDEGDWEGNEDSMDPVPCLHCGQPIGDSELYPGVSDWENAEQVLNRHIQGFWASHKTCLTEDDGIVTFDEDNTPVIKAPENPKPSSGPPPYALEEYYYIFSSPWAKDSTFPLPESERDSDTGQTSYTDVIQGN